MVMMLKLCTCCERERWFTLCRVPVNEGVPILKFIWRCDLCYNEVDYTKPETALDEFLDDLLTLRGEVTH